jgi:hypothetical protein
MSKTIFIISHYDLRPKVDLQNLILQLAKFNSQIAVVINDDKFKKTNYEKINNVFFLKRHNVGMNIGAWNKGYKYFYDYENYFFFQDECFIKDFNFFDKYLNFLSNSHYGVIGETINPKWARPWKDIIESQLNYSFEKNGLKIDRVTYYMDQIKKWKIPLGDNATHLRALNLAFKRKTLDKINGFNIGFSKEQCIASEIAISKKVENLNLKVIQSNQKPFCYIGHKEWDQSGVSKNKI